MKRLLLIIPIVLLGCVTPSKTAYQTIATAEAAVLAANSAYLDSVVLGHTPTNSVPSVEAAFNDTQLALRTAAALASGGNAAPIPAMTNAKVINFTNLANSVTIKP